MPRRTNKNKAHQPAGRRPRSYRVVSVRRAEPDLERIAMTVFAMATNNTEEEIRERQEASKRPDPFVCACHCNCCKLRRIHEGLCPQPSDEDLRKVSESLAS